MNDTGALWGDPLSEPFWRAAWERRLKVQFCAQCERYQHYPRPFCLSCQSDALAWVDVTGRGTVYSMTRNWLDVGSGLVPPYVVALVDLDEGPRLLTNLIDDTLCIGDRVEVTWRDRVDGPPLPVFKSLD